MATESRSAADRGARSRVGRRLLLVLVFIGVTSLGLRDLWSPLQKSVTGNVEAGEGLIGGERLLVRPPGEERLRAHVVEVLPHDVTDFTEGLFIKDGLLYEGTGAKGHSRVTRRPLSPSGSIADAESAGTAIELPQNVFGEGIATLAGKLFELTWRDHTAYVYDLGSLTLLTTVSYPWEGWGLTTDGQGLILSDGTDRLRWLGPEAFDVRRQVSVRRVTGEPVSRLNELEFVDGKIYANIWLSDEVVVIEPESGLVQQSIDASELRRMAWEKAATSGGRPTRDDCLNGIAYDERGGGLYFAGKRWPELYRVDLVPEAEGGGEEPARRRDASR